jgi:hypothetical protein
MDALAGFAMKLRFAIALIILAGLPCTQACFYPPMTPPRAADKDSLIINAPYDLAWDATVAVIKNNQYRMQAQDPTHGIIEAQIHRFTIDQADCGVISSAGGKFAAEPDAGSSAEFNFYLKPAGRETTTVSIQATFSAPLRIPFRPLRDIECVSRGIEEARLLKEIQQQAAVTHRPVYKKAAD